MHYSTLVRMVATTATAPSDAMISEFLGQDGTVRLSGFGICIAITFAIPALVAAYVATVALRGSRPDQRAEILQALPVLTAALLLRGCRPATPLPQRVADVQDQKTLEIEAREGR